MKWISLRLLMLFCIPGTVSPLFSQFSSKSIHDFSNMFWNISDKGCSICHVQDNKQENQVKLSWLNNYNHAVDNFYLYSSSTLDAVPGQPDGTSKLCLSCHDGTIAIDNAGGQSKEILFASTKDVLGSNLEDDHPVSFVYDGLLAMADGELADPTTTLSGLGGTIESDLLDNQKLQCTSCHNVHAESQKLLVKSNSFSDLCLTCHIK